MFYVWKKNRLWKLEKLKIEKKKNEKKKWLLLLKEYCNLLICIIIFIIYFVLFWIKNLVSVSDWY